MGLVYLIQTGNGGRDPMSLGRAFESEELPSFADSATAVLESRREARVGVLYPVEVYSPTLELPLIAQVRDASLGGLCIATASPISLETLVGVGLDLPGARLRLDAAGVWQSRMSMDEAVLTGVKFLRPDVQALEALRQWSDAAVREVGLFLAETLRGSGVAMEDAMRLAQSTRIRQVPRGRHLYRRGEDQAEQDDAIFFIREGSVELSLQRRSGPPQVTAQLGPHSMLGGLGCVASMPHFEDARTVEDTSVLEISREAFNYLRIAQPLLAHGLSQVVMASHLRRADQLVARATD